MNLMQYFQRLESGDKIFIIDDRNRIREIELECGHLTEYYKDRRTLDGHYQLKSSIVEKGSYIHLTKVTYHEEMECDRHHVMRRRYGYEDTDKVAYLSYDEALSHLKDMIYQQDVMNELQANVNHELEPHLTAIKLILSNYSDMVDRHDIEASLLKSEDHQKLLRLLNSIDF